MVVILVTLFIVVGVCNIVDRFCTCVEHLSDLEIKEIMKDKA